MPHRNSPPVRHDDPGMTGERSRNETGELRRKRGDALVGNIEDQYHVDFGVRSDMKLDTLRRRFAENALAKLIDRAR